MSDRLRRQPLLASFALAALALGLAAAVVLPRLDGVEIGAAAALAAGAGDELRVSVSWRLASAPGGELIVRAPAPDGGRNDAVVRIALVQGQGASEARLHVPRREAWVVVAELHPAGEGDGLFDRLQSQRRRAIRIVAGGP